MFEIVLNEYLSKGRVFYKDEHNNMIKVFNESNGESFRAKILLSEPTLVVAPIALAAPYYTCEGVNISVSKTSSEDKTESSPDIINEEIREILGEAVRIVERWAIINQYILQLHCKENPYISNALCDANSLEKTKENKDQLYANYKFEALNCLRKYEELNEMVQVYDKVFFQTKE